MVSHVTLAAFELGLPSGARNDLARRRGSLADAPRSRVLQIRLSETAPGTKKYRVDGSLFDRTDTGLHKVHHRESTAAHSLGALRDLGRTYLIEWHDLAAQADAAERVQVEFLLPWSLLGHPVDRWLTDAHGYLVGNKYPVVVRSLDRLREPSWQSNWKHRWRALRDPVGHDGAACQVGWLALHASSAAMGYRHDVLNLRGKEGEVRAWLDTHPEAAGLALAFAYDHHDPLHARSVQEAVCEGVPLMVWRRDDGDPGELAKLLDELARDGFADLPAQLRLKRRGASGDNTADMHHHLTLLWDDPDCVHPESAFATPARPSA